MRTVTPLKRPIIVSRLCSMRNMAAPSRVGTTCRKGRSEKWGNTRSFYFVSAAVRAQTLTNLQHLVPNTFAVAYMHACSHASVEPGREKGTFTLFGEQFAACPGLFLKEMVLVSALDARCLMLGARHISLCTVQAILRANLLLQPQSSVRNKSATVSWSFYQLGPANSPIAGSKHKPDSRVTSGRDPEPPPCCPLA
jgi:hypothetical protein